MRAHAILAAALTATLSAQTPTDLLEAAVERSVERRNLEATRPILIDQMRNAWRDGYPGMSLSVGINRAGPGVTAPPSQAEAALWSWRVALDLQWRWRFTSLPKDQRELDWQTFLLDWATTIRSIWVRLHRALTALAVAQERLRVAERAEALAGERFDQVRRRFESGLASRTELLQAELAHRRSQLPAARSRWEVQTATAQLRQLTGLSPESLRLELAPDLLPPLPPSDRTEAAEDSPDVWRATLDLRRAELADQQSRTNAYLPQLSLGVSGSVGARPWSAAPTPTDSLNLGLGLSVPLDPWLPASDAELAVRRSRSAVETARLRLEDRLQQTRDQITNLRTELDLLERQLALARQAQILEEARLAQQTALFERGEVAFLSLESVRQDVSNAQLATIEVKRAYLDRWLDLVPLLPDDWAGAVVRTPLPAIRVLE